MYDLSSTADQRQFREAVRDLVTREIKPVILHPDRLQDPDRSLPLELVDLAAQVGLRTLALSEASGGAGADQLTCCMVLEELAAGDVGIASALARTSLLGHLAFDRTANSSQRESFLPAFLADDRYHLAVTLGESNNEVDWTYHGVSSELTDAITAVPRGSDWIVSGVAPVVANAPIAQLFLIRVETESGINVLLLPRATTGLTIGNVSSEINGKPAINWFHGVAGKVVFDECRVPANAVLGEQAAAIFSRVGEYGLRDLVQCAAMNLGVGRAAFEAAIDYTKLRRQGGRQIVEHQAIGTLIADMALKLEAARNMVWKAAWALDHPEAQSQEGVSDCPLALMAKTFVSEAVHDVAETAAECFGAMGVMLDMPLPKYVSDALMFIHSGTSNSVAKFRIAEAVAEYRR